MSIYEYDEEKHLRMEREESKAEGIKEGRMEVLTEQIRKKLAKGKTLEEIATEVEEDSSFVEEIIDHIKKDTTNKI